MSITLSKTVPSRRSLNQQAGATAQILALFLAAIIFTSLVVAFIGYQVGHRQGVYAAKDLKSDQVASADVSTLAAENSKLKEDVDALTKERDISMGNLERLTEEQKALETKNLQLAQVNDLLKSSVAEQGGVALKVIGSEIGSLPENTFEYRFDVAMIDVSGRSVRMVPRLTLLNATSMVEIPLEPSSYDINGVANIRGRFVMPEGFSPRQMKLELVAGDQKIQQLYDWQVGKTISDAPASLSEVDGADNRPISSN
ncbi:hypothetical protein AAX09_05370 [Moraxella bovoculi]|uniref:hypothetical protein n=1 Tax=Moraxella bovoculi TaxID=386891 RepID=UPI0006244B2F|nr:hypothetical protein [Moraxella bovoculi]AKG15437.2 hypothetical protein AAX08_05300 [Moraxella bovoculi]AKG17146.1 hypothetical protein AAX10_05215 [Moraxella bovoculi]AKG18903.1 hypothetical protein AAX09_05370 [Moraxella bovoculi]NSM10268.1 hypothetical protein [Moraxella bovoculi]